MSVQIIRCCNKRKIARIMRLYKVAKADPVYGRNGKVCGFDLTVYDAGTRVKELLESGLLKPSQVPCMVEKWDVNYFRKVKDHQ